MGTKAQKRLIAIFSTIPVDRLFCVASSFKIELRQEHICFKKNKIINMKAVLPIVLVLAGLIFAYLGITTFQGASADVEVLGLELGATDKSAQTTAIFYGLLSIVCFFAGGAAYRKQ